MLKDLGQVGLWLSAEGLEAGQLDEERVAAFRNARRAAGHRKVPGPRAMVPLLSYLREAGIAPAAIPLLTPLGGLLGQFRSWLVQERGLAPTTVLRYENTARHFLQLWKARDYAEFSIEPPVPQRLRLPEAQHNRLT